MDNNSLESGDLLAVLSRATHEELKAIADAINRALDVFITRDPRYKENKDDLTKIPEIIGEYLCRAGGHAARNLLRGSGPGYAEVVKDVAAALRIRPLPPGIVPQEEAILRHIIDRKMKEKTDTEKEELLQRLMERASTTQNVDKMTWDDIRKRGWSMPWFFPIGCDLMAGIFGRAGLSTAAGEAIGVGAGAAALGPILAAVGVFFVALQLAGPSLRGTIPAVVGVAFVRQRMLWEAQQ